MALACVGHNHDVPNSGKEPTLFDALSALETTEERRRFLRDLLTTTELNEVSARWRAAVMLSEGRAYSEIIAETGLSSTTVARVSRWLKRGLGGYRLALLRLGLRPPDRPHTRAPRAKRPAE